MQVIIGLVGVLIGGFIAAGVQWFVTPRVQRRIRREQRIEDQVLELTVLVRETIPEAARALKAAGWMLALTQQKVDSGDWDGESEAVRDYQKRLREDFDRAGDAWRSICGWRLSWLFDQIGERYAVAPKRFTVEALDVPSMHWQLESKTPEEVDAAWDAEQAARGVMSERLSLRLDELVPGLPGTPGRPATTSAGAAQDAVAGK